MYKRLNNDADGQGLGLFLVNKIIDASGGKVEVESELGVRSEFKLYLKTSAEKVDTVIKTVTTLATADNIIE